MVLFARGLQADAYMGASWPWVDLLCGYGSNLKELK